MAQFTCLDNGFHMAYTLISGNVFSSFFPILKDFQNSFVFSAEKRQKFAKK